MAQWAVVIPAERCAAERLFHHDTVPVDVPGAGSRPAVGDEVLVVSGGARPAVVALGRVEPAARGAALPGDPLLVAYTRRAFDAPAPADRLALGATVNPVDAATFRALADRLGPAADRRTWLVSLDLPIEAESPAEAVRQFWSYVRELGPGELPTYVSPSDDELAMQAFVLGEQANLDPEEDEDQD